EQLAAALEVVGDRARRIGRPLQSAPTEREYRELVSRVRDRIAGVAASLGEPVLIVSRGDPQLVDIEGVATNHFPSTSDGRYLGSYPADGRAAVRLLEAATQAGARALVLPRTAFWWLEYYTELRESLERSDAFVHRDEDCVVIRLDELLFTVDASSPDDQLT